MEKIYVYVFSINDEVVAAFNSEFDALEYAFNEIRNDWYITEEDLCNVYNELKYDSMCELGCGRGTMTYEIYEVELR